MVEISFLVFQNKQLFLPHTAPPTFTSFLLRNWYHRFVSCAFLYCIIGKEDCRHPDVMVTLSRSFALHTKVMASADSLFSPYMKKKTSEGYFIAHVCPHNLRFSISCCRYAFSLAICQYLIVPPYFSFLLFMRLPIPSYQHRPSYHRLSFPVYFARLLRLIPYITPHFTRMPLNAFTCVKVPIFRSFRVSTGWSARSFGDHPDSIRFAAIYRADQKY